MDRARAAGLGARRVGKEELLAADFVISNSPLSFGRDEPIDERLSFSGLHIGMLGRIDEYDPVLIEQAPITFDQDAQFASVLERQPRPAIRQDIRVRGRGHVERSAHALADFAVPSALDRREVDTGLLPIAQFRSMRSRSITP